MAESRWGRPGFEKQLGEMYSGKGLRGAVMGLSLSTRQRIYAFMRRGETFKRGTWNGCVLNAASGGQVRGTEAAAEFFHEPVRLIERFIGEWDRTTVSMSQLEANRLLEKILLDVGLTTESPAPKEVDDKAKVYRVRLFTSKETKMVEELRAEIDAGAFDEDLSKFQELCLAR